MQVLVLESSTTSAKALLYDSRRGVLKQASRAYPNSAVLGKADTQEIFELTMALGREVASGADVAAVALCSVWHSIALLDEYMNPSGGTFFWNYMEPAKFCRRTRKDSQMMRALYERTGCMPHVTYARDTLAFLCSEGASFSEKKLISQGAYHFYRLTGEFCESKCTMSGSGLLNIHSLGYDELALSRAGIEESQLGRLVSFKGTNRLNSIGAELLGIASGIPVVPAHADGAMNQLAACCTKLDEMSLSVGTSSAIRMNVDMPVLPKGRQLFCYYGTAAHISGAAISGATNCVEWFRKMLPGEMYFRELEQGAKETDTPPLFLPFLYGERCPGWDDERTGGFMNLRPEHTIQDMYLALQAGVLFNLRQCFDVLVAAIGAPRAIHLSGGILNSVRWTQLCADILNKEMRLSDQPNASAMGAAMLGLAAASGELIKPLPVSKAERVVYPTPGAVARYQRQYEAYLEAYERTRGRT